jgi:hypothetical protein
MMMMTPMCAWSKTMREVSLRQGYCKIIILEEKHKVMCIRIWKCIRRTYIYLYAIMCKINLWWMRNFEMKRWRSYNYLTWTLEFNLKFKITLRLLDAISLFLLRRITGGCAGSTALPFRCSLSLRPLPRFLVLAAQPPNILTVLSYTFWLFFSLIYINVNPFLEGCFSL